MPLLRRRGDAHSTVRDPQARMFEAVANTRQEHAESARALMASAQPEEQQAGAYMLAEMMLERGERQQAADLFASVSRGAPSWWRALASLELGRLARAESDLEAAGEHFRQAAVAAHPEASPAAWLEIARLVSDDAERADEAHREAERAFRAAIQWAERSSTPGPRPVAEQIGLTARFGLARLQEELGRISESTDGYAELLTERGLRAQLAQDARTRLHELDPQRLRELDAHRDT